MTGEGAALVACKNCGEPIQPGMFSEWVHVIGPGSVLYRCDPAKSGKPYGLNAEVSEPDAVALVPHRQWVQTKGDLHEGTLRFLGRCSCSWSTGWFLTAMQAWHAVEDHAPCLKQAVRSEEPS